MDFAKPDYLYRLAQSGSMQDRLELAGVLQDIVHTEHRSIAIEILLLLLKEAEQDLRLMLATQLAKQRDCPLELIEFLIYHNPHPIADPVLRLSPLLDDAQLMQVLHRFAADPAYAQSIAQRRHVSPELARRILDLPHDAAHLLLLNNPGTELNAACLDYLADLCKTRPVLQQPLLQRSDVTADVAARLFWYVSADLRQQILQQFPISAIKLDRLMDDAIRQRLDLKTGHFTINDQVKIKAERLMASGTVSGRRVMDALRQGDTPLFVCLVALVTHTRPEKLLQLLLQDTTETLSIIGHALRLTRSEFNGLYLLWRRQVQPQGVTQPHDVMLAQDRFALMPVNHAQDQIMRWQDMACQTPYHH